MRDRSYFVWSCPGAQNGCADNLSTSISLLKRLFFRNSPDVRLGPPPAQGLPWGMPPGLGKAHFLPRWPPVPGRQADTPMWCNGGRRSGREGRHTRVFIELENDTSSNHAVTLPARIASPAAQPAAGARACAAARSSSQEAPPQAGSAGARCAGAGAQ